MRNEEQQVVIIGAGPAGLALSYCLKKLGIAHVVLEQGETGNSWMHMSETLRLISPLWVNVLPGTRVSFREYFKMVPAKEFAAYLRRYRQEHELPVKERPPVLSVGVDTAGSLPFRVVTQDAEIHTRFVVCATGYYGNPYLPDLDANSDRSIRVLHARDFINVAQLRQLAGGGTPSVLIVGKRISAGQLMVELADAGLPVTLSTTGAVQLRPASLPARMKETAYYFYEKLFVTFFPAQKGNSYPPMDGGRSEELLRAGIVAVKPVIRRISDGSVYFSDTSSAKYDLIICATGYRPHLPYLAGLPLTTSICMPSTRDMQSMDVSGLYFMGLDNLRSFRSRTLRGIADDAKWLAAKIKKQISEV